VRSQIVGLSESHVLEDSSHSPYAVTIATGANHAGIRVNKASSLLIAMSIKTNYKIEAYPVSYCCLVADFDEFTSNPSFA
jgi:hypothetical protein